MTNNLGPVARTRKTGKERFHIDGRDFGTDVSAFWGWSVSDLVSNVTRGRLAEFIVALGLKIPVDGVRDEWGAYDLETQDGIKIEVKSAAYIQSWDQHELSQISFRVPKTLAWDPKTNLQAKTPKRQADVYVFALLEHQKKETIDPLNINQWKFFVVPTAFFDQRIKSQHSITLKTLRKEQLKEYPFDKFLDAVRHAKEKGEKLVVSTSFQESKNNVRKSTIT